jgi:hypothetical protein
MSNNLADSSEDWQGAGVAFHDDQGSFLIVSSRRDNSRLQ